MYCSCDFSLPLEDYCIKKCRINLFHPQTGSYIVSCKWIICLLEPNGERIQHIFFPFVNGINIYTGRIR